MIHSFNGALSIGGGVSGQVKYTQILLIPTMIGITGQYRDISRHAENGA
jgi:hypothetical protein